MCKIDKIVGVFTKKLEEGNFFEFELELEKLFRTAQVVVKQTIMESVLEKEGFREVLKTKEKNQGNIGSNNVHYKYKLVQEIG